MGIRSAVVAASLVFATAASAQPASTCDILLKFKPTNTVQIDKEFRSNLSTLDTLCRATYRSLADVKSHNGAVGFNLLQGFGLGIDGSFDLNKQEQWKETHCESSAIDKSLLVYDRSLSEIVSDTVYEFYVKCREIENRRAGVFCSIIPTGIDGAVLAFDVFPSETNSRGAILSQDITITNATDPRDGQAFILKKGTIIPRGGQQYFVKRSDPLSSINLSLNFENLPSCSAHLPGNATHDLDIEFSLNYSQYEDFEDTKDISLIEGKWLSPPTICYNDGDKIDSVEFNYDGSHPLIKAYIDDRRWISHKPVVADRCVVVSHDTNFDQTGLGSPIWAHTTLYVGGIKAGAPLKLKIRGKRLVRHTGDPVLAKEKVGPDTKVISIQFPGVPPTDAFDIKYQYVARIARIDGEGQLESLQVSTTSPDSGGIVSSMDGRGLLLLRLE